MLENKNPFASPYYVYHHIDPETNEIVYVGYGQGARAWMSDPPFRSPLHSEYLGMLEHTGYTADQWVFIYERGLYRDEARSLEYEHIRKYHPTYNRTIRYSGLKFNPNLYDQAEDMRANGLSYQKIADILGVSTMTVYRGLNNKTISLEVALEER